MTLMMLLEQVLPSQLAEALILRQQRKRGMEEIKEALSISYKAPACCQYYLPIRCLSPVCPVRPTRLEAAITAGQSNQPE